MGVDLTNALSLNHARKVHDRLRCPISAQVGGTQRLGALDATTWALWGGWGSYMAAGSVSLGLRCQVSHTSGDYRPDLASAGLEFVAEDLPH